MINTLIMALFVLCAILYTLSSPLAPYPLSPLIKVLPVILLSGYVWRKSEGNARILTLLALLFSGCGDVLLALQFEASFIAGLSAFLIAHLFFMATFIYTMRHTTLVISNYKHAGAIAVLVYSWFMAQWVMPEQLLLKFAVILYVAVISFMCITAIFAARKSCSLHLWGALIFACSDSLIAWDAFRHPITLSSIWIMSSYYLAQLLLVLGIVKLASVTANARHET